MSTLAFTPGPTAARRTLAFAVSGVALLLGLVGCAAPPPAPAEVSTLQRLDTALRGASAARPVSLRLAADQVRTGDALSAQISSPVAGYVYIYQLGTDGKALTLVFPNAMDGANYLAAGATLQLPRTNWRMSTRGPAGVGYLMAAVTEKPLDLMALMTNTAQGRIELTAPYGAALVPLREVAP